MKRYRGKKFNKKSTVIFDEVPKSVWTKLNKEIKSDTARIWRKENA